MYNIFDLVKLSIAFAFDFIAIVIDVVLSRMKEDMLYDPVSMHSSIVNLFPKTYNMSL